MIAKRKLTSLTYADKLKVIEAVKSGIKRKQVAAQFGIRESTLSAILKKEADLLKKQESGESLLCKRQKNCENPFLEQCLFTWVKQCREKNISVNGPILREKAKEFAKWMKIQNFRASNGWLENFKKRYDLAFKRKCGKSVSISESVYQEWKSELQDIVSGYDPNDVFNADETGLFFTCLPHNVLTYKNEKCHGGEYSDERLTILLCVNSTGTEKLKPLTIGKSKKRHCFESCDLLPVDYEANNKAWMTPDIFKRWLNNIDKQMVKSNRKIILFIHYSTPHEDIPPLKAVKVQFLPPNTTAKLQPLNHGIIKYFKTIYRKEVFRKMITDIEQNTVFSLNIPQAIWMVDKAWQMVTSLAVQKCFRTCGFPLESQEIIEEEGNKMPEEWNEHMSGSNISFEDFVTCDDEVITGGILIEEDILDSTYSSESQEFYEEEDEKMPKSEEGNDHKSRSNIIFEDFVTCDDEVVTEVMSIKEEIWESTNSNISSFTIPLLTSNSIKSDDKDNDFKKKLQTSSTSVSINDARRALMTVRSFIEQCSNVKDNVFSSLFIIENQIDLETAKCLTKEIPDFSVDYTK